MVLLFENLTVEFVSKKITAFVVGQAQFSIRRAKFSISDAFAYFSIPKFGFTTLKQVLLK